MRWRIKTRHKHCFERWQITRKAIHCQDLFLECITTAKASVKQPVLAALARLRANMAQEWAFCNRSARTKRYCRALYQLFYGGIFTLA